MKTELEIKKEIPIIQEQLENLLFKHTKLNQIDMLSSEGSGLRKQIHLLQGYMDALIWVLYNEKQ